jgi:hypothetical protein
MGGARKTRNIGAIDSCCPLASKESRNLRAISAAETGTVFGTVRLGDLEP